jgi:endoglucanase
MTRRGAARLAGVALITALAVAALAPTAPAALAAVGLRVRGNQLVDGPGAGHVVQLRGINRSGLEYACVQGWGFFDSPHPDQIDDPAMITAMNSWDINVVRVPLNEDCWLGLHTPAGRGGPAYRGIVARYVRVLNAAHLYVILDLHFVGAGGSVSAKATGQLPMADQAHAPAFWRSVARTFKSDHELIFDLFNEPFGISWGCWRNGCRIPAAAGRPAYEAAGMQTLVDVVRSTGATQPLLLGGVGYAGDVTSWTAHVPRDPRHQLLASEHNYGGLSPCGSACEQAVLRTERRYPVVFGELGETDCAHGYVDRMMGFADRHGIGYLGWAWDATSGGSWTCGGGPSLITSYDGSPTPYGIGLRNHLRSLPPPARPALP